MKKLLLVFLLGSIPYLAVQAQSADAPYMTKAFANAAIRQIEVSTTGGSIAVSGAAPAEARVEVYIRGNNNRQLSQAEIERALKEDYELTVGLNGDKLVAKANHRNRVVNWKKGLSISFKIYAPKQVSTRLETSGGSIALTQLTGQQRFSTSGGSLRINEVTGQITGATSGGSIHVANSSSDIALTTSGGSIEAANCSGNIRLSTSGGSLRLDALKGNIKAHTSGGSIRGGHIEGVLDAHTSGGSVRLQNLSCSVNASTSGGSVDVQVDQLGDYVRLNNSGGNIDLQLPKGKGLDLQLSGNKVSTSLLTNFSGKADNNSVHGSIGGGGTQVVVKAGSGKVNLTLQ